MTVRYYRWDDASAPVLNATKGAMNNVLDKCLVSGYGSKAAAGWTKVLDDVGKAKTIFQNAGSGAMYQVQHDGAWLNTHTVGQDYTGFTFRGCAGFANIDDLVGAYPRLVEDHDPQLTTNRGVSAFTFDGTSVNGYPWMVVADESTCYVITMQSTTLADGHYVMLGDVKVFGQNATVLPKAAIVASQYNNIQKTASGYFDHSNGATTSSEVGYSSRSIGGGTNAVRLKLISFLPREGSDPGYSTNNYIPYPNPILTGMTKYTYYIAEDYSDPLREVVYPARSNQQLIYATLPGAYNTPHIITADSAKSSVRLGVPYGVVTDNGRDYLMLKSYSIGSSGQETRTVLDITGPW